MVSYLNFYLLAKISLNEIVRDMIVGAMLQMESQAKHEVGLMSLQQFVIKL